MQTPFDKPGAKGPDSIQPRFFLDRKTHSKMKIIAAATNRELQDLYAEAVKEKLDREFKGIEDILK